FIDPPIHFVDLLAASAGVATIAVGHGGVPTLQAPNRDLPLACGPRSTFLEAHHIRVAKEEFLVGHEIQPFLDSPSPSLGYGVERRLRRPEFVAQKVAQLLVVQGLAEVRTDKWLQAPDHPPGNLIERHELSDWRKRMVDRVVDVPGVAGEV